MFNDVDETNSERLFIVLATCNKHQWCFPSKALETPRRSLGSPVRRRPRSPFFHTSVTTIRHNKRLHRYPQETSSSLRQYGAASINKPCLLANRACFAFHLERIFIERENSSFDQTLCNRRSDRRFFVRPNGSKLHGYDVDCLRASDWLIFGTNHSNFVFVYWTVF